MASSTLRTDYTTTTPYPNNMARWARKVERFCCLGITYFPLVFVYGITTWAVWVEASLGFNHTKSNWIGNTTSFVGIVLYILLNWSYTKAVFTNPGSTIQTNDGYSSLPVHAPPVATSFTVKSTGELRFCKKCQARKPDRAHHCSSCRRCVLKMDHHCPWLATCVGLKNYKFFLLFLTYVTLFCGVCFAVSASWFWTEILSDGQYNDTLAPVNNIMLAVISGIIGIVLFGFTGWHLYLAGKGQTTIECLEKTRYLSPLRKSLQHQHIENHHDNEVPSYGQQLMDIHTNVLPGVTRPEEGDTSIPLTSTSQTQLIDRVPGQPIPHAVIREREEARQRHEEYLDELDSEKLPNAFDLGWKRNLLLLFGHRPLLWFLPVYTTIGDGWAWEPSPKWLEARDTIRREREEQRERESIAGWGDGGGGRGGPFPPVYSQGAARHYISEPIWPYDTVTASRNTIRSLSKADRILGRDSHPSKADRILGRVTSQYADVDDMSSPPLHTRDPNIGDLDADDYDSSSDEHEALERETDLKLGIPPSSMRSISPNWSGASGAFNARGGTSPGISPIRKENLESWNNNVEDGVD